MACTWLLPWLGIENGGERQWCGVKYCGDVKRLGQWLANFVRGSRLDS